MFVEPPFNRSDEPPSPLPNPSVASPVAHQEESGVSSSFRTRNAIAGVSEKQSRVAWGKGRESESVLSENAGMAAAVLSSDGLFMGKKEKMWSILTTFKFPLPTPIRVC